MQMEVPESTRLTEVILQPLCEQSRAEPQVTRGIAWMEQESQRDRQG